MNPGDKPASPLWIKLGIAAGILILLAGGAWFFQSQHREQREQVKERLWTIALLKADQIAQWRAERLTDAAVLAERRSLIESASRFLDLPSGHQRLEVSRLLRSFKERYHFTDILIVDMKNKVRFSLSGVTELHREYAPALEEAVARRTPVWTSLHAGEPYPFPHISVAAPVFAQKGDPDPKAALILVSDAEQFLYPLIQSWPTPAKTAETLLVRREGDGVLFLNELRHQQNTALRLRIPLNRIELPAAMAAAGRTGVVEGKDYRGVEVMAAVLAVPDSPWFIVAKIDAAEALSEWRFRSAMMLLLMLVAVGFLGIAALVLRQRNLKAYYRDLYQSEAALRRAMERNSVTLQAIGDAVISTDEKGRVELMNPEAQRLTAWEQDDARGRDLSEVFHIINEETRERVESPMVRVIREGAVVGLANHTVLISRDGREIPIADSGAPIRDDRGEITGVVLVFRDQSEERLRQRLVEARLSLIKYAENHSLSEVMSKALDVAGSFVNSPLGFYHFVHWDQKTLSLQAWSSRTVNEFCRTQGKGMHYGIEQAGVWVDCVRRKESVVHNDYASLPHKKGLPKGHPQVIRELVVPVMREEKVGAILGVGNKPQDYTANDVEIVSYLADVTWEIVRHKCADEALQKEKNKIEQYLNIAGVMLIALDSQGEVKLINRKGSEILGYPQEDIIGRNWFDNFLPPEIGPKVKHVFTKLVAGEIEAVEYYENAVLTYEGEERIIAWHNSLLKDDEGNITGTMSSGEDITERKRVEQERDILQGQLLRAQKMESVGRLAGGVAHDFNNILGVILGHSEMMLAQMTPGDPHYADLEEIHKAAERSAALTRQLLAFASRQTIAPKVLDLNQTVEGMLKMLRRMIGEDIDLIWKPGSHLWPVKMDPAQVDQVLANLCVNARDAIAGTGKVTIETKNVTLDQAYCGRHAEFKPGDYVMLALSDDGCGMDSETLEYLFEPFFTTKETGKGTGLGLATVYGIVKQNKGLINVYSEPGRGTAFKIYIPRHEKAPSEEETERTSNMPKGSGEVILLVEDDPGILGMGKSMLERLGYSVLTARGPREALDLVKGHDGRIDLLITDVVMPNMNGRDLAGHIEALRPGVKILFMSGYTANAIAHHGVLDPNVHFVQKPFSMQELAEKVKKALVEGAPGFPS